MTSGVKDYRPLFADASLSWTSTWTALAVSLVLHLLVGNTLMSAFSPETQAQWARAEEGRVVFAALVPPASRPTTPAVSGVVTKPQDRRAGGSDVSAVEPVLESQASERPQQAAQSTSVTELGRPDQVVRPTASAQRFRWRGGRQAEDRDLMVQQSIRDGMSTHQLEQLLSHLQSLPRNLTAGAPVECELSAAGVICNAEGFAEQPMIAQLAIQIYRVNPGFRPIWLKRDSAGGWSATSQSNQSP
jgi:hypothetical protein